MEAEALLNASTASDVSIIAKFNKNIKLCEVDEFITKLQTNLTRRIKLC